MASVNESTLLSLNERLRVVQGVVSERDDYRGTRAVGRPGLDLTIHIATTRSPMDGSSALVYGGGRIQRDGDISFRPVA
ncbi:hypothetical protein NSPZN2_40282 [Nitrospira defluvii]|uniref:Uncharacterized protein n=1 Tax=Nitrospira defluvii TaxID=330214 RepID=A0ABM8RTP8_9BACT|nr:hypothetical protein NSPZN2_40282 [Nitrospira defluvii]